MRIEFRGVSTASLGTMLGGYGVMAGVGAVLPDARFWWTQAGLLVAQHPDFDDVQMAGEAVSSSAVVLKKWAKDVGKDFEKVPANRRKGIAGSDPPLMDGSAWDLLQPLRAIDAEGVGVAVGAWPRSNPVLANWGQDGRTNLFSNLWEAEDKATGEDFERTALRGDAVSRRRLGKAGGVLFPAGIKRYATGAKWIHAQKKPVGVWDFILAMRGLLLLRGAVRSPRGSRFQYPAFPFVLPGSAVRIQGSTDTVDEIFLPTWGRDHPRTLAEFLAQVRSFQTRLGRRDFASGAADFRRAVAGRAITGAFDAFHRFALEPRKPGDRKPQTQAVARGITRVGPASAVRTSLRFLLAPLDDSGWLDQLRLKSTGSKADPNSEKLALTKTRFDEAVHAAIDLSGTVAEDGHVRVLKALWDCQIALRRVSDRGKFLPAPLLDGCAWRASLSELLHKSPVARLGWALASLGWAAVQDGNRQDIRRPVVEQVLPVTTNGHNELAVSEDSDRSRVPQPGHNPARELAALSWRRWLDLVDLPVLPATGTRPADAADVAALLCGDVDMRDLQRHFLAFLLLDGNGDAPPPPAPRPIPPAYAALRLWFEMAARATPIERRPLDGLVPRGIATGTVRSVQIACRTALHRLRLSGLPGDWPGVRPREKCVARPDLVVPASHARLMAAAMLIPVSAQSVARLSDSLLLPSGPHEPNVHQRTERTHA